MTKNKLADLNDHLFAQLERLGDESLTADQVEAETKRANAMVGVADQIIGAAKLRIDAARLFADHGDKILPYLPLIGNSTKTLTVEND